MSSNLTSASYNELVRGRSADGTRRRSSARDIPPVFNKRLFASQGVVIITQEARRIMKRNAINIQNVVEQKLSKSELLSMRAVIGGLALIHKSKDHIKDVLSHVVTLETYGQYQEVRPKHWEDNLSCYYIVTGGVEVTYDVENACARNVYQPHITYNHGTGEYLGIVSAEGNEEDISPPSSVVTKETTQLLRIDRTRFHSMLSKAKTILLQEVDFYLYSEDFCMSHINNHAKEKLLSLMEKEEHPPNKVILKQDEASNFLYIIKSGRCECCRNINIPEATITAKMYLTCRENDDFFGEECILDNAPSYAEIRTTSPTVCYKIPRVAFEVLTRDNILETLQHLRHDDFPSEENLQTRGYKNTLWNNYKFSRIKESLEEVDKRRLMWTTTPRQVAERPPSKREQYKENMYRFIQKGSKMEQLRVRSAVPLRTYIQPPISPDDILTRRKSSKMVITRQSHRPVTAVPYSGLRSTFITRPSTAVPPRVNDVSYYDSDDDSDIQTDTSADTSTPEEHNTVDVSSELAKIIETIDSKEGDAEDEIAKILEGDSELSKHLRRTWDPHQVTEHEKEGFMKNGVLVSMKSEDIVRKAMAMVGKQTSSTSRKTGQEWANVLQTENNQAKFMISANKVRINMLRNKMEIISKEKQKERLKTHYKSTLPAPSNV